MKERVVGAALAVVVACCLIAGCKTAPKTVAPTTVKPATVAAGDLEFTEEIIATVTADQKFEIDGKLYAVSEIPQVLKTKKSSEYVTMMVTAESKLTKETLAELLQVLVDNGFLVAMHEDSKYADITVPKKRS